MLAFRGHSLSDFCQTGLKTFEQYLDTACLHHGLIPPTSANPLQHGLRAHLQVMLWKAVDQSNDITNLGWVIQDTIPIPGVAQGAPVSPELLDVIKCQCKAQGKQCSTHACMQLPQATPCMHISL